MGLRRNKTARDEFTLKSLLDNVYSLSKRIIEINYKDEINILYPVWMVMKEHLSKWKAINPDGWSFSEPKNKLIASMGFARPSEISNMAAPGIIAMTAGVLWKIGSMEEKPYEKDIEGFIDDCSKIFNISHQLKMDIKEFLVPLCLKELPKMYGESKKKEIINEIPTAAGEKEYEVYINGNLKPMTRREVEKLEANKNEYIAWVWVDDERSEIIIGKDERDIKPDSIVFKFLCEILKRVGKDLLHKTIYEKIPEVKKGIIHQHLNKLKEKTSHVLDSYITGGKRFRFSISKFNSCLITKKVQK